MQAFQPQDHTMSLTQEDVRQRITNAMSADAGNDNQTLAGAMRSLVLQGGPATIRLPAAALHRAAAPYTRDLTAGTATAGGFLVPTKTSALEALLTGEELADLGVNVRGGFSGPMTVPRVAGMPTPVWLAVEGGTITETQPSLGSIGLTPKSLAIRIESSRQLILQSGVDVANAVVGPAAGEQLRRTTFGAVFSGSGTAGQPTGLVNTAGIGTVSGTSLGATGLRSMLRRVLDAGGREQSIRFVADPTTAELLGSREFSAGSGLPCWHAGQVLGRPAIASNLVPANTVWCGDFSRANVWLFDADGAGLEADPYSGWASGIVAFRMIVAMDFSFSPAAAFCVATSVT
jgi:HK97 family phage major capsid protein